MKITLSTSEMKVAQFIARSRQYECRKYGVVDVKRTDKDPIDINVTGFVAELAFAKFQNVYPDLDSNIQSGGYDGVTKKGYRYDIKATTNTNGNLLCTTKINPDIDVYILAYVTGNEVEFVGWIFKKDFIKPENIKNLGRGNSYFMDKEKLNKFI
jgi:hypothetical protein